MLTFLEICENIRSYKVGTMFRKYEVVNGFTTTQGVYLKVEQCELFNSEGNKYYGKKLKWSDGTQLSFNEEMLNFKFKQVEEYEKVSFVYALKCIEDGSEVIYTNDYDGNMVDIELDDDMGYDFDIDSFADLLKRTKFYIKK